MCKALGSPQNHTGTKEEMERGRKEGREKRRGGKRKKKRKEKENAGPSISYQNLQIG